MNKSLLTIFVGGMIVATAPAIAADMRAAPVYKAPVLGAPAFSWTGFYVGGNAGYAWGSQDNALGIVDGSGAACHFFCTPANDLTSAQAAGSPRFNPQGFTGGGQFGYNWQASNWVYGIEFDFGTFQQKQSVTSAVSLPSNTANSNCTALPCAGSVTSSMKADWLMTLRPRIGYAWDRSLVYATGGLAVTKLSFSQSYSDNIDFFSGTGGSASANGSKTVAGWTIGAGFEQAFANNWSVKAEYLYTRFDGLSVVGGLTDGSGGRATFNNSVGSLSSNIVRGGVNYRF